MRPPADLPPVDYLVLWQPYTPSPSLPWWWRHLGRRLVKPGFAHCLVVMIDPAADVLTVIDPVFGGVAVRNLPLAGSLTTTCARLACQYPATTYCLLQGRRRDRFPARPRWGLTCVSVVAAILGLETTPLTPWRLYRHVRALAEAEARDEGAAQHPPGAVLAGDAAVGAGRR
jgi:hypothetical protein